MGKVLILTPEKKQRIIKIGRELNHLFLKSGNLTIAIEHFLVSFPSMLLMAKTMTEYNFSINSISLLLFSAFISNLTFIVLTNRKIPVFIGPSFAFVIFLTSTLQNNSSEFAETYLFGGYLTASVIFIVFSILYKSTAVKRYIKFILPDALIGPLISLIGLDLLEMAIEDSGFIADKKIEPSEVISIFTLLSIIIITVIKKKRLSNASIMIGVLAGWLFCILFYDYSIPNIFEGSFFAFSEKIRPAIMISNFSKLKMMKKKAWELFFAVLPATMVVFTENITKITLVDNMLKKEDKNEASLAEFSQKALFGHAFAFLASVLIGAVPNTVYAQNVALMNIENVNISNVPDIEKEKNTKIHLFHNKLSIYPYCLLLLLLLPFSFLNFFQIILKSIPLSVYGGMELFVFALISAQGFQLLVDRKVDYKRVTNQIVTSVTLLAGLSGLVIKLEAAEIKGLSLAFMVGSGLNILFKILAYFGYINEPLDILDISEVCYIALSKKGNVEFKTNELKVNKKKTYGELDAYLKGSHIKTEQIEALTYIKMSLGKKRNVLIENKDGNLSLTVETADDNVIAIRNDFISQVTLSKQNKAFLEFIIDDKMSKFMLKSICQRI